MSLAASLTALKHYYYSATILRLNTVPLRKSPFMNPDSISIQIETRFWFLAQHLIPDWVELSGMNSIRNEFGLSRDSYKQIWNGFDLVWKSIRISACKAILLQYFPYYLSGNVINVTSILHNYYLFWCVLCCHCCVRHSSQVLNIFCKYSSEYVCSSSKKKNRRLLIYWCEFQLYMTRSVQMSFSLL